VHDPVTFQWTNSSQYTGNVSTYPGVWSAVEHHVPSIIPLTCGYGRYSTIHSTYYHCYLNLNPAKLKETSL